MKRDFYEIVENRPLTDNVLLMKMQGDTSAFTAPGQFLNVSLDGFYLRRPISVCSIDGDEITIIYKVVGGGTKKMSQMKSGEKLDVLTGLGNGFAPFDGIDKHLVVGGGVGVPPMYGLAKELIGRGLHVTAVLGFNTKKEVFFEDEFKALGAETIITTADGSYGTKGFVTDAMKKIDFGCTYSCGPLPMLKAVYDHSSLPGQFSFEERMGCGFGACMGCTCKTKYGHKRICREGPVLSREEIIW